MIFNNSFSYKHIPFRSGNYPVDVIVNFAVDGRFKPIYFKYMDEKEGSMTFKIDAVHYTRDKHDSILFSCFITRNSVKQEVYLIYRINECIWTLESA